MKKLVFIAVLFGMMILGSLTAFAECKWDDQEYGMVATWDEYDNKITLNLYKGSSYKVGNKITLPKGRTSYDFTERIREMGPGTYHFEIKDSSGRSWTSEPCQVTEEMIEEFRSLTWVQENGQWKLKDYKGNYLTGWQLVGNVWYYMDKTTGYCLMNTYTPDGYYVGPTGAWDQAVPRKTA